MISPLNILVLIKNIKINRKMIYIFTLIFLLPNFILCQTTNQIQEVKKIAQSNGLSIDDVVREAKAKGFTDNQIDNVLIKEKQNSKAANKNNTDYNPTKSLKNKKIEFNDEGEISPKSNEEFENQPKKKISQKKGSLIKNDLDFFGYKIFKGNPNSFQSGSVGSVDPNYLIGPKDEIIIMMWGETQFRQIQTVDKEGFIFLPEIGQVFVNGLNFKLLESKLFKVFSQSYASLKSQGGSATSFLDISLGNLRPLRIQVLGEVKQPGAYIINPSSTLFSALYYFNGPTFLGSLRDIHLIRGGKKIKTIDFYNYLLSGKKLNDESLQLDDVIFIPKRLKTVTIDGEVNRPGIYELNEEESLKDLIQIAGDMKASAYVNRIQIDRVVPFDKRKEIGMDRMIVDIESKEFFSNESEILLYDFDKIKIDRISKIRGNVVTISGAVNKPGIYELKSSLSLESLINIKADGLIGEAYKARADIIRTNSENKKQLLKININDILNSESKNSFLLQNNDEIIIYNINELRMTSDVKIRGHVKNPSDHQFKINMRISDLLFYGGGFLDNNWINETFLKRADLIRLSDNGFNKEVIPFHLGEVINDKNHSSNFLLKPGDEVVVYSKESFNRSKNIILDGDVKKPGSYKLKDKMTIKDLILESGGVSKDVYNYNIEIARIDTSSIDGTKIFQLEILKDFSIKTDNYKIVEELDKIIVQRNDFLLEPYDFISVRSILTTEVKTVEISGEILYPGKFALLNSEESLKNIITRSGGLKEEAFKEGVQIIRNGNKFSIDISDIFNKKKSKNNLTLKNKDKIFIPQKPLLFQVIGEVSKPGYYPHNKKYRINNVLEMTGGLTKEADKNNIIIAYPKGITKRYSLVFGNHEVSDGSIITIGRREEKENLDINTFLRDTTEILANLVQVISIIYLATK